MDKYFLFGDWAFLGVAIIMFLLLDSAVRNVWGGIKDRTMPVVLGIVILAGVFGAVTLIGLGIFIQVIK